MYILCYNSYDHQCVCCKALEDKAIQIGLVSVGESIEESPPCNHDDAMAVELAQTREALLTLQALVTLAYKLCQQ